MAKPSRPYNVSGEAKDIYLNSLDKSLGALARGLKSGITQEQQKLVADYGNKQQWDWTRLPDYGRDNFSGLVDRVRKEYQWFHTINSIENPNLNRAWFDSIDISPENGLPFYTVFVDLRLLKEKAPELLQQMPSYNEGAGKLRELLMQDYTELKKVSQSANEISWEAMKRNFLEQLVEFSVMETGLADRHALPPIAERLKLLGAEELWQVRYASFSPGTGFFYLYDISAWQDNLHAPQIKGNKISSELLGSLDFAADNDAWYMLKKLDSMKALEGFHPVQLSFAIIGPYECKYMTHPDAKILPVARELIYEDPNSAILRFRVKTAFAPNHIETKGRVSQIVKAEDFLDDTLVCPAKYAQKVSNSVLGPNVRIIEAAL